MKLSRTLRARVPPPPRRLSSAFIIRGCSSARCSTGVPLKIYFQSRTDLPKRAYRRARQLVVVFVSTDPMLKRAKADSFRAKIEKEWGRQLK